MITSVKIKDNTKTPFGGSNIENSITIIDGIPNDGGDW